MKRRGAAAQVRANTFVRIEAVQCILVENDSPMSLALCAFQQGDRVFSSMLLLKDAKNVAPLSDKAEAGVWPARCTGRIAHYC
jgi:hypothetical protein